MDTNAGYGIATSKLINTFSIDKPSVRNELFRVLGKQGLTFFGFIESMGYVRSVTQPSTTQYEETWIHQTIHVGAGGITVVDAPNGIYSFILSVAAGTNDLLAGSIIAPYPTTATNPLSYVVPVQQWDRILFPENGAVATVQSVVQTTTTTTFTVTIKLANLSYAFTAATYTAGYELSVIGNAFSEGSDQNDGKSSKPDIDHAYTQIIKGSFRWTGSQATSQPWFTEYAGGPDLGGGYFLKGQTDADWELQSAISTALWVERPTTNSIVDTTTGEPIYTTEGLIPYIERKGNAAPYTGGAFSIGVFDYVDNLLERQFAPRYVCCMNGTQLDQQIENALKAYFQNTLINYTMPQMEADLFTGDKDLAMSVGFNCLQKSGGRTYCFTRAMEFNHPKLLGVANYPYPGLGVWFPLAKKKDSKTDFELPYMGMIYRELNGYSRKAEVWTVSGAGPGPKVLTTDLSKLCMRSNIGAEHVGGNQMVKLTPQ
jgi:hypothetical protein